MLTALDWESNFFGIAIASLDGSLPPPPNTQALAEAARPFQLIQRCEPVANRDNIGWLERAGFHYADSRVTLSMPVAPAHALSSAFTVSKAQQTHNTALKALCSGLFNEYSRYKACRLISDVQIDHFYQMWVHNSICAKHDDGCYILEQKGETCGFITLKALNETRLRIGLIAVGSAYQGKKMGSALLKWCASYAAREGYETLQIAASGRNIRAINAYIRQGFTLEDISSWYYLEPTASPTC